MKKEIIRKLAEELKQSGFRVFIAANGDYGFFTNKEGSKVVSFQVDLGCLKFSGNYKTDNPKSTGTGWGITDANNYSEDYKALFDSYPPSWAVGCSKWSFTTLDKHLATYQASSKYQEV